MVQWLTNPTRNHKVVGLIPGLAQWVRDQGSGVAVSFGVGRRQGSDPAFLWLRHRPVATALTRPLSLGTSIWCRCGPRKDKKTKIK